MLKSSKDDFIKLVAIAVVMEDVEMLESMKESATEMLEIIEDGLEKIEILKDITKK